MAVKSVTLDTVESNDSIDAERLGGARRKPRPVKRLPPQEMGPLRSACRPSHANKGMLATRRS